MQQEKVEFADQAITQKSTVSLTLVGVIISGIVANVGMVFDLKSDVALISRDVEHVMDGTRQIREQISNISAESREAVAGVRGEIVTLREQIFELRARILKVEQDPPK